MTVDRCDGCHMGGMWVTGGEPRLRRTNAFALVLPHGTDGARQAAPGRRMAHGRGTRSCELPRVAFYPGTFDPVTNGHVDLLKGALAIADKVVVGIGVNPSKSPLFSLAERKAMVADMIKSLKKDAARASLASFEGLAVDAARAAGATLLIRGLRDGNDFEYEMQMAGTNRVLAPGLQTVFLPSDPTVRHITATLVRQIAAMGGDVTPFVPLAVARRIARRKTLSV